MRSTAKGLHGRPKWSRRRRSLLVASFPRSCDLRGSAQAGEEYLVASDRTAYPEADDTCIYCQQTLDAAGRRLLQTYRSYASGAAVEALRSASERVTSLHRAMLGAGVNAAIEGLRSRLPSLSDAETAPDWVPGGQALLERAEVVHTAAQRRARSRGGGSR